MFSSILRSMACNSTLGGREIKSGAIGNSSAGDLAASFSSLLGVFFHKNSQRLVMNILMRGRDEAFEERMRLVRLAQEFRMKLACEEIGMVVQFDHFHEFAIGRIAAENEAGFLELFPISIIEF